MKLVEGKIVAGDTAAQQQTVAMVENSKKLEKKIDDLDQSIPQRFREKPAPRTRSIQ